MHYVNVLCCVGCIYPQQGAEGARTDEVEAGPARETPRRGREARDESQQLEDAEETIEQIAACPSTMLTIKYRANQLQTR